ncbi:SDR family oxidoreductase [Thalassobacillus sp. CUG 92003]|uniref:SDR family oxidoreductase n=1 Tax=Thalassobacillus sp. CUG 92003 TaxID=2736641 RepID=UPI0015E79D7C|nr:SDR family oxidoreductase [Thalassobacillus sp. CUG 92003]
MSTHENLKGKVAIVTGGGGVLCSAMAKELARQGVSVVVLSRRLEKAESVAADIKADGGEAHAFACDVLNKDDLIATEKAVNAIYPAYHILINGAGGNHPEAATTSEYFSPEQAENASDRSFFDLSEEGLQHVFNLNFMGTVWTTQVFAERMIEAEAPAIINISSMSAYSPMTKVMAYSAAKSSINNFTEWLAVHLSKQGIRVNAIAPGFFLTEQNRGLLLNEDGSYTERSAKIISQTPAERFGEPEDLLGPLLWLADPQMSKFVTGVTVPVDGGFQAYSGV